MKRNSLSHTQAQTQTQTQTLSPQQVMVVRMLELTTLELEDKVRSEIMENPALIEQISNLAKGSDRSEQKNDVENEIVSNATESDNQVATVANNIPRTSNRSQLLGALKPYVSKERAKAIDSMLAIADILDMMKAR